ncbi:M56 family metallopeptidase [Sphingobium algorifonticola]|uniref:Energy transducer TonB n=1 Tax=Sphingobium algorifonticola TaxID=2008318 RepID=A0A437J6K8_9SPHN|nr:M56 family metallopeptidase [Sphingobium algorifonticola]RVT40677.1 energy transducer TonB [Sphingobium algorifonticola]
MTVSAIGPWLAEALIASALLMATVLVLRQPVMRFLGARAAYALWIVPALRFVLPPLPDGAAPATLLLPGAPVVSVTAMREAVTMPATQIPWLELAVTVWLGGVILFLAIHGIGYLRFRGMMLRDGIVIGRSRGVTLLESVHATGPLAFGIVHRHVVVPIDFTDRYTASERQLVLAHEYTHHARGDLAANLLAIVLLALHWGNPIAWFAYRAFRADQELACDAQVLGESGQDKAQDYGRAILKAAIAGPASGMDRFSICHLNSVDTLKGRLKMLSTHSATLHRITWGMSAVAVVTVAGLALTASGSKAAQEMATVSRQFSDTKLSRLASLLPSSAPRADLPEPQAPLALPSVAAIAQAPDTLEAPEPPAPPAATQAPAAPMPPAAPSTTRRVKITSHDGTTFYHDIAAPTEAEIAAMVPIVRVDHRCDGAAMVRTQDYSDASGKRHVNVSICQRAIDRTAMAEAKASMADAKAALKLARAENARTRAEAHAADGIARAQARAEDARARAEAHAQDKAARALAWAENERARAENERARAEAMRERDRQNIPAR